jgi:hypothetical protein
MAVLGQKEVDGFVAPSQCACVKLARAMQSIKDFANG